MADGGSVHQTQEILEVEQPKTKEERSMSKNERIITSMLAGAVAGGVAKTAIAPLDNAKIFFQTSKTAPFTNGEVFWYIFKTYRTAGFKSLWRGNSATMVRIVPYAAIQFTAHEEWKRVLRIEPYDDKKEVLRFLSGSLAGVTAQTITYPLDLTRARLAVSHESQYKGLTDVLIKTFKQEGLVGLFKGYIPTMMGVIPYAGCSFYCYEGLKRIWTKEFGPNSVGGVEGMCFGAVAGVFGQCCAYPLDIVRRRMQTLPEADLGGGSGVFRVFNIIKNIANSEGIAGGLFKGLSLNWIKGPIAAGISFACYDWTLQFVRKHWK